MALAAHTKMKLTTRSCKGKVTRFFFYRTFSNAHLNSSSAIVYVR